MAVHASTIDLPSDVTETNIVDQINTSIEQPSVNKPFEELKDIFAKNDSILCGAQKTNSFNIFFICKSKRALQFLKELERTQKLTEETCKLVEASYSFRHKFNLDVRLEENDVERCENFFNKLSGKLCEILIIGICYIAA